MQLAPTQVPDSSLELLATLVPTTGPRCTSVIRGRGSFTAGDESSRRVAMTRSRCRASGVVVVGRCDGPKPYRQQCTDSICPAALHHLLVVPGGNNIPAAAMLAKSEAWPSMWQMEQPDPLSRIASPHARWSPHSTSCSPDHPFGSN
jgi:hypothetical protein